MRIGIVGGTGREGTGLAARWAKAGHAVRIGSRDAARAQAKAGELATASGGDVTGGDNAWCAEGADVVLVSVPYAAHGETLRGLAAALRGKIVIDITVPLQPPKVSQVHLPAGQAAALEAQEILGAETRVVATLHHVSSDHLGDPAHPIHGDVLLVGDDEQARATVAGLLRDLGLHPVEAGPLRNAIALEALTPVLLWINRKNKITGAGVKIVGL